jgi:hypothetical protein
VLAARSESSSAYVTIHASSDARRRRAYTRRMGVGTLAEAVGGAATHESAEQMSACVSYSNGGMRLSATSHRSAKGPSLVVRSSGISVSAHENGPCTMSTNGHVAQSGAVAT